MSLGLLGLFLGSDLLIGFLFNLFFESFALLLPVDGNNRVLARHAPLARDDYVSVSF